MHILTNEDRERLFGSFPYVPDPRVGNNERVQILNDWPQAHLVDVEIGTLLQHAGLYLPVRVRFHRLVAAAATRLFATWRDYDLHHNILSWNGSYAARFRRGQPGVLSAHAWGSAFDINARWNPFGKEPAHAGEKGSVRELVSIAKAQGWIWGGEWHHPDGMHFEATEAAISGGANGDASIHP